MNAIGMPLITSALELGLAVFPCGANKKPAIGKKEGGRGFHDASRDPVEIERMFARSNVKLIGVPTGDASGWDVLDLDYRHGAKAFEDANAYRMPETRVHETQSGGRHLVFRHAPGVRNSESVVADGVDVRGEGGYFISPPSPGYRVISDAEPVHWPDWLLELVLPAPVVEQPRSVSGARQPVSSKRIEKLIGIALDKVRGAPDGQKHYTLRNQAVYIGGLQHLADFSDGDAVQWLMDALPDSAKDRRAAEQTAAWGIATGKARPFELEDRPLPGRPKTIGNALNNGLRTGDLSYEPPPFGETEFAKEDIEPPEPTPHEGEDRTSGSDAIDACVDELNDRFMVVNEAGKAVIYQPDFDPVLRRRYFTRLSFEDQNRLYLNRQIQVGVDDKGHPLFKTASYIWQRHYRRRQYIDGIRFDPSGRDMPAGVLNLWEGFAVTPAPGDWSLLRKHMLSIICDGDRVRFNYLLGWMARMVQRPAEQGEVAIVMRGGEGTGKGTFVKALLKIMGQHGLAVSNSKHLVGNFNAHLRDAILLFVDEAFFAGDRAHVGVLKSLITEPYLTVEAKFQNAIQSPNFLHVMMASNEEWVIPASQDARRFFVLEVSEKAKNDHAYFGAIATQMEAGGHEAMLHDLLALDLTGFNVRAVPVTDGLQRQRKLSLPTTEAWWQDCLDRGYVFRSRLGLEAVFGTWHEEVSTELLFASYLEFAEHRRERQILSRETMGRFMKKMGAKSERLSKAPVGEHLADDTSAFGSTTRKAKPVEHPRPWGYALGSLANSRRDFTAATGLSIDWCDAEDEICLG